MQRPHDWFDGILSQVGSPQGVRVYTWAFRANFASRIGIPALEYFACKIQTQGFQ
jgi:hypothetical protein